LGEPRPSEPAFDVAIATDPQWAGRSLGRLALANRSSAAHAGAVLNAFVHGSAHADLKTPFVLEAFLGTTASLVLHLNSVSSGAILSIRANGIEVLRRSLPNRDAGWQVNNEYNEDIRVALPTGRIRLEVRNVGQDWFYLDWVRFEGVLPAAYDPPWEPSPEAIGLQRPGEALLYVVNPSVSFPGQAKEPAPEPMPAARLVLTNRPPGAYRAEWFDPATGRSVGETRGSTADGALALPLPMLNDDLAGIVTPELRLHLEPAGSGRALRLAWDGDPERRYVVFSSSDLRHWKPLTNVPSTNAVMIGTTAADGVERGAFFRGERLD
jgi:hypothetical protein